MRMTQEEIDDQKKIEFYAASVSAWYESSLEHDKSLLKSSANLGHFLQKQFCKYLKEEYIAF